jgi:hypothetical protein
MDMSDVPLPPESPGIVNARIVQHPESEGNCLLVTTEDGEHMAFGFEVETDAPGLVRVDPRLWLEAAKDGAPESNDLGFEAVQEPWADDWLQALVSHPVAAEWLAAIKHEHPGEYSRWFEQEDYDEGGEGG